jgi:acyl-[acyl-carrier-protein]-phospholipid O-acyltransferase/long-chain-fatty-acid--[acyl-carrier-protein] ligase
VYQIGNKEGSVGHPIPSVAAKIVSLQTRESLVAGKEGLLLIKGPNVMLGYLNMKDKADEVLKDGWYDTGDIAKIDADGFITITDRLSRFSKIAGEMVPHVGVEEVFLNALGTTEQFVAVTAVPDDKKGEELIVFYLPQAGTAENLHEIITKSSLPNLWKPRRDNYIKIESMPTLGSGKLDVAKLKEIALSVKKPDDKGLS